MPKNTYKVLVIDDNEMIFNDFVKVLTPPSEEQTELEELTSNLFGNVQSHYTSIQYQLDFATSGQAGLEYVKKALNDETPYLITFVDMQMPHGWNGIKTIQEIWRIQPDLNIILCTAYSDISWDEMHSSLPTNDRFLILKKPFDIYEVKQISMTCVRRFEMEETLHKNTEKLHVSQRLARIGYFKLNPDYEIIETSEIFNDFLNFSDTSSVKNLQKILNLLPRNEANKLLDHIKSSEHTLEHFSTDCHTDIKNTTLFEWIKISGFWTQNESDDSFEFLGSIQDITESKKLDHQLMLLEKSLSQVNDMVIITDIGDENHLNHKIVYLNASFEKQTGYKVSEMLGTNPRFLQGKKSSKFEIDKIRYSLKHYEPIRVELLNYKANGESFWCDLMINPIKDEKGKYTHWVSVGRDITENKLALENIKRLAYFDSLTGLSNRQFFNDKLNSTIQSLKRNPRFYALMLIDLDNFKELNDTVGHDSGDQLLIQVSRRLKNCTREDDTVARLGGDEFVILLGNIGHNIAEVSTNAELIAKKINKALSEEFKLIESNYRTSASIGITIFGKTTTTPEDVLRQADIAMYKSKETGKNSFSIFNNDMQQIVVDRAAIADRLKVAIAKNEFELYFQPQFDLSLKLIGAEALLRWNSPQMGSIPPSIFIPIAEQNALIIELGNWVLDKAAFYLSEWSKIEEMKHLVMSVNVSTNQFSSADFLSSVFDPINKYGTSPQKLNLELTETIMVSDFEDLEKKLKALKALGIKIALDDFGTGFSTLNYLKRLSLDELKIDQSFVQDLPINKHDTAIARTIISLGQSLGLKVTAEGVETSDQLSLLSSLDCDQFQGFFFSKPISAVNFVKYSKNYKIPPLEDFKF